MRAICAALVAMTMTVSGAFAADGTLTPGKPAGVKQAQITNDGLLLAAGVVLAAGAIALIATSSQSSTPMVTTVTTTSTTGTSS
jgi:hypothetical protein